MSSPNENYSLQYNLKTLVFREGLITQSLQYGKTTLSRWVLDSKEKAIREALIKLGWIPPEQVKEVCSKAYWCGEATGDYTMKYFKYP